MSASRKHSGSTSPALHTEPAKQPRRAVARRKVRFGDVTVLAPKLTEAELKARVDLSTEVLRRLGNRLLRPGVRIPEKKNIPYYHIDPENSGFFIRRLNGKVERGVLEGGEFKVVA